MAIGPGPGERGGLRERKKLAVRRALSSAAIRLAVGRGLENVTIEDIAAEADVSVRTFGNYFSGKYEAICALGTDRARCIGAELLGRPAREPLWEALVHAMLAHYEGAGQAPDAEWLAGLKLVLTAPAIRGEYLKVNSAMQQALAEAIAARTGTMTSRTCTRRSWPARSPPRRRSRSRAGPPPTRPSRCGRCCDRRLASSRRPAPAGPAGT